MSRRSSHHLIFDSLQLEGGLFVPAILEQATRGELAGQGTADYRIPQGLSLADEQGRAFRIASALWKNFDAVRPRRDVPAAPATLGFALDFFRDALGFADITPCAEPVALADRAYPITAFAAGGRVPLIVAPHDLALDEPDERFVVVGSGARRRSAYQLAQQFLNASPCAWAILTNGRQLRLVRDADTLTRPAYLEADLELILRDQRYADFAAVWRLFHASRAGDSAATCLWDVWRKEGQEQGEPVREGLRTGVTDALLALGTGFLAHPDNEALRARLDSGALTKDAYFQQLLRLVYRFLFVFTVEERRNEKGVSLLHVGDDSPAAYAARELYRQGYAFHRFRDRALRRAGFDRFGDLWAGVRIVFRGLAAGEPRLALPALGGLFAAKQCPDLDAARLDNRSLLTAMRHLRWAQIAKKFAAIDYRNMGPEELGSVYESLLELVPTVDLPARRFGFVGLTEAGRTDGNARKTTGSYYTPDSLVQELLDSALDPVIAQKLAAAPDRPAEALLSVAVIDPACGSGHFLLAAARRLAERLAEVRATEGAVTPDDYRAALHEVVAHCIYGVDRNPMALELARTALWLEGYRPGQPLSFLDSHLVCGDALLGLIDFKALQQGIPADAFKPLTGDAKEIAKALATENRTALKEFGQRLQNTELFSPAGTTDLLAECNRLETLPEATPAEVEAKAAAYERFLVTARESPLAKAADLYVAAFLAQKATATDLALCPTTQKLADLLFPRQGSAVPPELLAAAETLCREARVLHWPLAFAGIFARGGFDCVLGNPPWEVSQMGEEEFFAARDPRVAEKAGAQRKAAISALVETNPLLWREYQSAFRLVESTNDFYRESGRFSLTATGKLNTYPLFAETILHLTASAGRSGFIVPTGIATDDSTKDYFGHLAEQGRLASLFDFENREKVFPAVDSRMKFCLLTLGPAATAEFAFFMLRTDAVNDSRRRFSLTRDDFRLINPNTRTCPVFRSQADAELTKKIYRKVPVLIEEAQDGSPEKNPWGISFSQGLFNMTSASHLFLDRPTASSLPLYEAKMIHQFDHRWATYAWNSAKGAVDTTDVSDAQKADPGFAVTPRYWVEERHVLGRLARVPKGVTQAWASQDEADLLAAFATWIEAANADDALSGFSLSTPRDRVIQAGGKRFDALPAKQTDWLDAKLLAEARDWSPLSADELALLHETGPLLPIAHTILDRRSPRWLMGWRRNARTTDERTMISSILPRSGVGDSLFLMLASMEPNLVAALLGSLDSLIVDYVARQKLGGVNFSFYYVEQLPVLPPTAYTEADLAYLVPRVLELTYTSHDLAAWAADLGYTGAPFRFDPDRRVQLRAELDACYARLYGLTRDELRYILDPADTHGPDYPTETFRGLKANELREFGEYRTRRLVLAAWDALSP